QISRDSPFSIWDWRQYHAKGLPDLKLVQRVLEVLVVLAAFVFAFVPRRKSPLQLAALTGVLLLGFELVLTHWFYLYIPWFFPFVAYATLARAPATGPIVLPALGHLGNDAGFRRSFETVMWACGATMLLAIALSLGALKASPARVYGTLALAAVSPLLLGSVVLSRYDLWPAALTAGAIA